MALLLDDQSIEQFAAPLGLVVLAYSNFDAAITDLLAAIHGAADWRKCPDEKIRSKISPANFLKPRLQLLKNSNAILGSEVFEALQKAEDAIKDRDTHVHGPMVAKRPRWVRLHSKVSAKPEIR